MVKSSFRNTLCLPTLLGLILGHFQILRPMALSWWLGVFHYGDSRAGSVPGTWQGVVWAQTFLWHPWLWGETGRAGAALGSGALSGPLLSTAPAMLAPLQSHIKAVLQSKVRTSCQSLQVGGWQRVKRGVAGMEERGLLVLLLGFLHFPQKGGEEVGLMVQCNDLRLWGCRGGRLLHSDPEPCGGECFQGRVTSEKRTQREWTRAWAPGADVIRVPSFPAGTLDKSAGPPPLLPRL